MVSHRHRPSKVCVCEGISFQTYWGMMINICVVHLLQGDSNTIGTIFLLGEGGETVDLCAWPLRGMLNVKKLVDIVQTHTLNHVHDICSLVQFSLACSSVKRWNHTIFHSGFGHLEVAQLMLKLMKRLGHEKFYVQGGDWGSVIATDMSTMYPHRYSIFSFYIEV